MNALKITKSERIKSVSPENQSKPATKAQLWALFAASKRLGEKHDYRADGLTMQQASDLLQQMNARQGGQGRQMVQKMPKPNNLEKEFLDFMRKGIPEVVEVCRQALGLKSIVQSDPTCTPKDKIKTYAFIGFGCGISIIRYDKRSKLGGEIIELSRKHHFTTLQREFLSYFSSAELAKFNTIGHPIAALWQQDVRVGAHYAELVADFMRAKGCKKVRVQTYDD